MSRNEGQLAQWLLRSKVTPPRQLASLIQRPALIERLEAGAKGAMIVLEAPGGYGKSSLLSEWCEKLASHSELFAWLSTDEDDDADTFIAYLAFACHVAGVETAPSALLDFDVSTERHRTQAIYQILAAIERSGKPVTIVLDDFERARETLRASILPVLLRRIPANATLVVATRDAAGLDTLDLDHRGLVTRIGPKDLRFTRNEIRALWGKRLSRGQLAKFEMRTEGWPVLVRLLLSAADIGVFDIRHIDSVSYTDQTVTAYFEEKILSRLDGAVYDFLLKASIFDEMTRDIVADILGADPDDMLRHKAAELEAFVAPLPSEFGGFRLHPMLRDYLRHNFREHDEAAFRATHLAAAGWHSARGGHVRAVRHALESGDRPALLKMLEDTGGVNLWIREGLIEFRAIDRMLTNDIISDSPIAAFMRTVLLIKSGRQAEASRLLEATLASLEGRGPLSVDLQLTSLACRCVLKVYCGEMLDEAELRALRNTVNELPDMPPAFDIFILTLECLYAHQSGRLTEAASIARRAIAVFRTYGSAYGEVYIRLHLAMALSLQGEALESKGEFAQAAEMIRRHFSYDEGVKIVHDVLRFEAEHETAPFDAANIARLANLSTKLLRAEGWIDIYAGAYRTLAEKLHVSGRREEALHVLHSASAFAQENGVAHLAEICLAQEVILHTLAGRREDAARLYRQLSEGRLICPDDPRTPWRVKEAVAEAGAHLALAGAGVADAAAIDALRNFFRSEGNLRATARLSALLAALGDGEAAKRNAALLEEALAAQPLLRAVALVRAPIAATLCDTSAWPRLSALLGEAGAERRPGGARPAAIVSGKELAILREVQKGRMDKEIALVIGVSEHTVRYHLKNIYAKLNAHNRVDAVRKAEALGVVFESG